MNYSRIGLAAIAGTIVFFVCGFLIFGLLIGSDFAPYGAVYRSQAGMQQHAPVGMVSSLIARLVMSIMYAKGYEGGSGVLEGFRFGALVGLFLACKCVADEYVTLNIGGKLALEMAAGVLVEMAIVGMVIGMVYKPKAGAAVV
jgi:hypothetical protein